MFPTLKHYPGILSQSAIRLKKHGWILLGEFKNPKVPGFGVGASYKLWSHPEHPETSLGIKQKQALQYLKGPATK